MAYQYYNQFNLSNELSQSISSIISVKEKDDYICKIINVTIPEHKGLVFHSPLTTEDICRPGASALSGAQIAAINREYGWYDEGIIPAKDFPFFVVIKNDKLEEFSKMSFCDEKQITDTLQEYSIIYHKYFGTFDSRTIIEKFPYLQCFFDCIDEWRAETNRVTVDEKVLKKAKTETFKSTKRN